MELRNSFIKEVCTQVLAQHKGQLHTITLVVPAKRSVRFFINAFIELFAVKGDVGLLPTIITLSDFTDKYSPYYKLSQIELVFHFYQVYCTIEPEPEPFEKFYTWAPSLLADFNELDNYMLDPAVLYRDLRNIKEIEEWSFGEGDLSDGQQKLNDFWVKMPLYYKALQQYLIEQGLGYSGMINRYIAEHLAAQVDHSTYVFAGFNALTKCEIQIISYLLENKNAQFFIDADEYYTNTIQHEAGLFVREHLKQFSKGVSLIDSKSLRTEAKTVELLECNGETMQCSAAMQMIKGFKQEDLDSTAVVLCNEQLLPVLINSFPAELNKVNVTMGWPLRFTQLYDFCEAYFNLCQYGQRQLRFIKPSVCIQFTEAVFKFFKIDAGYEHANAGLAELKQLYTHEGILSILNVVSEPIPVVLKVLQRVLQVEAENPKEDQLHSEICVHFIEVIHKLGNLPSFAVNVTSWHIFKQLFSKFSRNYPLAFVGEPFSGIQVMGMLETRALDFKHVFILSANEGFLPAQTTYTGYIPYDLRAYNKLPGKAEQDAVFAYYFYRLLQRATNVYVFYNSQSELLQQAEKSRYILQLVKELAEVNPSITIQTRVLDYSLEQPVAKKPISKTAFYLERVNDILVNGISASALNTFNKCQLDFYHKYILGFREPSPQGIADESVIGNITHLYFNKLFEPYIEKKINGDLFRSALDRLENDLYLILTHYFPGYDFSSGQNFLAIEMVRKMVSSFLGKQIDSSTEHTICNKYLLGTEISLETRFEVAGSTYKLKGTVDVLMMDDDKNYFVYDFKTGKANEGDLRLGPRTAVEAKAFSGKDKLLQMLVYHRLVSNNYEAKSVRAQIIPLASGAVEFLSMEIQQGNPEEIFEKILEEIVLEMLNEKELIVHNTRSKFCDFCL